MKKAIILHGMPKKGAPCTALSNEHWLPWLQQELVCRGVLAQTPELPNPISPVYEEWRSVFEQFSFDRDTDLIGHSCGAGFLVRWLSENKQSVRKVVLVAPWMDPKGEMPSRFFDFTIDPAVPKRVKEMTLFLSHDDDPAIKDSAARIEKTWPFIQRKNFEHCGHFLREDMGTCKFPALLDVLTT